MSLSGSRAYGLREIGSLHPWRSKEKRWHPARSAAIPDAMRKLWAVLLQHNWRVQEEETFVFFALFCYKDEERQAGRHYRGTDSENDDDGAVMTKETGLRKLTCIAG